jgi:dihydroxy-acid dehydratase
MNVFVLMGGCDKTVPTLLMRAVSAGKSKVMLVAGLKKMGRYESGRLGACADFAVFGLNIAQVTSSSKKLIRLRETSLLLQGLVPCRQRLLAWR